MRPCLAALLFAFSLLLARGEDIRVVTWNMEWFPGGQPNASQEAQDRQMRVAQEALIALKPDILLCEEVRDWDSVEKLISVVPGLKLDVISNFTERSQNQAIASRFPMDSGWSEDWKRSGPGSPPRGYVFAALTLPDGRRLLTYALHLKSNNGGVKANIPKREDSARQLLRHVIAMVKLYSARGSVAVLIGGDFNTSPDPEFATDQTIPLLQQAGLDWTFAGLPLSRRITHPGAGRYSDANFDHIFTAGLGRHTATVQPVARVSDHRPVILDFKLADKSPLALKLSTP